MKTLFSILIVVQLILMPKLEAEVVLDGSMGTDGTIAGPVYQIHADLSRQAGENLFHSFSQFNIDVGEHAVFHGSADVQNIISRVTGGNLSTIDGRIDSSAMPNANFFLLNPAGIIFGADASLNIGGSFTASTASYLEFSDGEKFFAQPIASEILSSAPISAFGFTDADVGTIEINGSQLKVNSTKALNLVGGDISIDSSALVQAADGQVNIISVQSTGVANINNEDPTISTSTFKTLGALKIQNASTVDVSGSGGGHIQIRADSMLLNRNAGIHADSEGTANARGVDIIADSTLHILNGSNITSSALHQGHAGLVSIRAGSLFINRMNSQEYTGVFSVSDGERADTANAIGHAGDIQIWVHDYLEILAGGGISSATKTVGDAGSIFIQAGTLLIDGRGSLGDSVSVDSMQLALSSGNILHLSHTGISSTALPSSKGKAGHIDVTVSNQLEIYEGGLIDSSTYGEGDAGLINIQAQVLY